MKLLALCPMLRARKVTQCGDRIAEFFDTTTREHVRGVRVLERPAKRSVSAAAGGVFRQQFLGLPPPL
jgi:hypothetical protein